MLKDRLPILTAICIACGFLSLFVPARLQAGITTQFDTIRVMDYNLLNYPGSDYSTRNPYFRKVVHTARPDILVVEEMTSQTGVNTFLSDVLNYYQSGLYSTIAFHDGPDTDPHIYYKSSKVTFLSANYFLMEDGLRYVSVYMVKETASGDTIRLYAVHLKASTGYETQRGAECTQLRDTLNNLSPGTKFMVMGDFNFYNSSTEPGFTKLTESETNNNGRLKDPINQVGNWHDNAAFAPYHTQSPRTRQFGGGSNGGMDDRFDFILTSYSSLDNNTIVSSYKAYGNDGNHLNDSINHLPNSAVPDSVANGLHYASDHLPVICDFQFASGVTLGPFTQLLPSNGATAQAVSGILRWQSSSSATGYDVYLGTTNPPTTVVSSNQSDTSYNYSGLGNNTVYYWKAVAKNGSSSLVATGSPWSFTTVQAPPVSFSLTSPANGATGQLISGTLIWQTSTNATGYDVYLSTSNPPMTKVSSNQSGTTYSYNNLQYSTTYYWKVVAKNLIDSVTATGSPWSFTTRQAPPASFSLTSPANGATGQTISGTLSWQASTNATGYDVFLGTNNPPTTKVSSNQSGTSYSYGSLQNNTTYYWKVVAKNAVDSVAATGSPWSFITIQAPPVSFNLTSPANSVLGQSISGTLTWQTSTNATGYDVFLSTSNPPTTKVSSNQSGTTYSYSGLQYITTYYWKVVARNAVDSVTAAGSPWNFTTIVAAPGTFNLLSPSSGSSNRPVSGTLGWQSSSGATSYDVYLGTINPPTTKISSDQSDTTYAYSSLSNSMLYYWKIVAKNAGGSTSAGGSPWSFTTIIAAPGSFTLISPSNGAGNQPVSGTLSWQTSTGASSYDVYLDTNSLPTTVVSTDQPGTSFAYGELSNGTTYRWKVVAKNVAGSTVASGAPWNFTTVVAAPSAFNPLSPSNGSSNRPVSGTLGWQYSSEATSYDVYLGTTNPPTAKVSSDQPDTTYAYSSLSNSMLYYWKVVAKNAGGSANASGSPWSFATIIAAPGAFNLLSPSNEVVEQSTSGTLSWQASENAGTYDVYLDTINPPAIIKSANQIGTVYNYSGLSKGKTYFWKVTAKNIASDTVAANATWSFVTAAGDPPGEFVLLAPSNGAGGLLLSGTLSWTAADSADSYDVYLDMADPPTMVVAAGTTMTSYVYAGRDPGTTYYWKIIARNIHGTTIASNAVASFSTGYLPATPSGCSSTNVTTTRIEFSWADNANNEDGYRILCSTFAESAYVQVGHDLPANSTSFVDTGLNISQRYYYRVVPFNNLGEGNPASFNITTLASTPAIATLVGESYSSIRVTINPGFNSASTEYAIQMVIGSTTKYVQADGSTGAIAAWLTYVAWGDTTGAEVRGLRSCAEYTFSVQARNGDHVETGLSNGAQQTTQCFSVTSVTSRGWNLMSIPVTVMDARLSTLFPNSSTSAFSYQGRYVITDSMQNGSGFWLKFRVDSTTRLAGDPRSADTFYLKRGWNIVGSISSAVSVGDIEEDPTGTVLTPYYGYGSSYTIADSIRPMRGYWVKARATGKLILTATTRQAKSHIASSLLPSGVHSLVFMDQAGHRRTLYLGIGQYDESVLSKFELPPIPPAGAFDVRFASQRFVELLPGNGTFHSEFPIEMQAVTYPLTLSWQLNNGDHVTYAVSVGGQSKALAANGQMTIAAPTVISLKAESGQESLPKEFALEQNYPNPFNPQTIISYQLPTDNYVSLKVYTVLGQEAATLVSGMQKAGYRSVSFDGSNLPSGVYFYRMTAGHFSAMKKMLLLK